MAKAQPAWMAGKCGCCMTPYQPGTPIRREGNIWVLVEHPASKLPPVKRKWAR